MAFAAVRSRRVAPDWVLAPPPSAASWSSENWVSLIGKLWQGICSLLFEAAFDYKIANEASYFHSFQYSLDLFFSKEITIHVIIGQLFIIN